MLNGSKSGMMRCFAGNQTSNNPTDLKPNHFEPIFGQNILLCDYFSLISQSKKSF